MVKLNCWDEINKALFRRHIPAVISANEMLVFRKIEEVFSGKDKDGEIHQCFCGDIFYLGKAIKKNVPKDWLGNPVCPRCGKALEAYEDREWRNKFSRFAKITEALRRFEESEPSEKLTQLKKLKKLTEGLFEFSTTIEMYVGYYKLMTELMADKDDTPNLKAEWKALIDSLFEKAKTDNLEEFIKFIFSPDPIQIRQIEDTIRESKMAVVRMEKDYFLSKVSGYPILLLPLTMETIEKSRIRFSLLLYSHLIELNALYDLTMNLIRVSEGKKFEKEPIPPSIKYPAKKIREIAKANPQIGTMFKELWVREVRNAFAHSKYKIEKGFFVKTDEDFKIPLADLQAKINLCSSYWRYLHRKIGKEQVFAYEKKVFHTRDGTTITISGQKLPPDL